LHLKYTLFVSSMRIPGATISYVQFWGVNAAQSELRARHDSTQDRIFGVDTSSVMQRKFVGITPAWSSAQHLAARQIDVTALALLPGSPAIDTGNSTFAGDQRYLFRPENILNLPISSGNTSDIGAFEVQPDDDLTNRPVLFITRSSNNVELRWDIKALAFTLDSTLSLTPPSSWAPVSGLPTPLPVDPVNNQFVVTRSTTPNKAVFYRLRAP
jgi:hypothetical protein